MDTTQNGEKRMVEKILGRMEVLKGFIRIPAESRKEFTGDIPVPSETLLNGENARLDSYGRLWSSFLISKFPLGSRVQLVKTTECFRVELIAENHKGGTATSSFGSPGRFGHDSSKFYNSRLYAGLPKEKENVIYFESEINKDFLAKIFCKSSEHMVELPDDSVHLMVTSPPYNVGKEYDQGLTLDEYKSLLKNVFNEVRRVLVPGGRACVNIANLGRKPYIPLDAFITQIMLDIGFLMRGEIVWDKGSSAASSTAWGSWRSASNPTLRDVHEYILVFSKGNFGRPKLDGRNNSISKDAFLQN